jgi:hypothetical protein
MQISTAHFLGLRGCSKPCEIAECPPQATGQRTLSWLVLLLALIPLLGATKSHADVVVLIEEPINFLGRVTSTGHIALYFDHLCSDNHANVRKCRPGKSGVVISRHHYIARYDWLAMAESILSSVRCPVLIVGPSCAVAQAPFHNILFATNLETTGLRAAQFASSLAERFHSPLTMLHVVEEGTRSHRVAPELVNGPNANLIDYFPPTSPATPPPHCVSSTVAHQILYLQSRPRSKRVSS